MIIVRPGPVNVPAEEYRRLREAVAARGWDWQVVQLALSEAAQEAAEAAVQGGMRRVLAQPTSEQGEEVTG